MDAIILSVGDELVLGQTVDTNSAWVSRQLAAVGCGVAAHVTVPDDQQAIERAMKEAAGRADFLIVSGGIGPTADDLTRQALAAVMGAELAPSEFWLGKLKGFFEKRGRPMPEMNTIQAMIPRGANLIDNTAGTAAGIDAVLHVAATDRGSNVPAPSLFPAAVGDSAPSHRCRVFVMPGVPSEMKSMFSRDVLPHISAAGGGAAILSRTLHTFGLGESVVAQHLGALMDRSRNPSVGTTVSGGIVSLRVNARFASRAQAEEQLEKTVFACRAALGDLVFGQDDKTLPGVVAGLLAAPDAPTIAAAETCTGGLVAKMLTDVPASAGRFVRGWVAQATEENAKALGLPPGLVESSGPVSESVAAALAHSARDHAGTTLGVAVTGRPGEDDAGGSVSVGTVCLALSHGAASVVRTFNFPGDRDFVRDRAAKMALTLLRYHLLGKPLPF